jgi:hypothetical protein
MRTKISPRRFRLEARGHLSSRTNISSNPRSSPRLSDRLQGSTGEKYNLTTHEANLLLSTSAEITASVSSSLVLACPLPTLSWSTFLPAISRACKIRMVNAVAMSKPLRTVTVVKPLRYLGASTCCQIWKINESVNAPRTSFYVGSIIPAKGAKPERHTPSRSWWLPRWPSPRCRKCRSRAPSCSPVSDRQPPTERGTHAKHNPERPPPKPDRM